MTKTKQKPTAQEAPTETPAPSEEVQMQEWNNLPVEDKIDRIVQNAMSKNEGAQIMGQLTEAFKTLSTRVENVELKLKLMEANAST